MLISEDKPNSEYSIRSYQPGEIHINTDTYTRSVIISLSTLITDWPPQTLDELELSHLNTIIQLKPEIVLLGTGTQFKIPDKSLLTLFHDNKIGIEFMDTRAACRTFMALAAEERNVVGALLIN